MRFDMSSRAWFVQKWLLERRKYKIDVFFSSRYFYSSFRSAWFPSNFISVFNQTSLNIESGYTFFLIFEGREKETSILLSFYKLYLIRLFRLLSWLMIGKSLKLFVEILGLQKCLSHEFGTSIHD